MKIAIIHDHLTQEGGAEKVLKEFHEIFPDAPIFTLVYDKKKVGPIVPTHLVRTSFIQKIPFGTKKYQWLLPLMPTATERYDLSEFDVVLSSSSAFSKGVITRPDALHICYCHTPTRYLWTDSHSYIKELDKGKLLKPFIPFLFTWLRIWDRAAADRVDLFIANSKTVADRIKKYYRRSSDVIYPPVEVDRLSVGKGEGSYFLAGGRLVAYKRFDIIVRAFNRLHLPLKIFGTGPEYDRLRAMAKSNITFLGKVSDEDRAKLYENAIAFINPQEEDFGITAVESMAAGRPVIAYAKGGALETVIDGVTGVLFYDQDWAAIANAVVKFKAGTYNADTIRAHAEQFSSTAFKKAIKDYVLNAWEVWNKKREA